MAKFGAIAAYTGSLECVGGLSVHGAKSTIAAVLVHWSRQIHPCVISHG